MLPTSTCIPDVNLLEPIMDMDQIRRLPEGTTPVVLDYGTAAAATLVRLIFDNNPDLGAQLREKSSAGTEQAEQLLRPWFRAALHLVQYPC